MKMKYLIFALFTVASASSFTGCNDSTPTPEESTNDYHHLLYCTPCENEKVVDTLISQEATVVLFDSGLPNTDVIYILSLQKEFEGGKYVVDSDSILVPCPPLPKELRESGKKVIVSLHYTNCTGILIPADARTGFGRRAEVISIKSN